MTSESFDNREQRSTTWQCAPAVLIVVVLIVVELSGQSAASRPSEDFLVAVRSWGDILPIARYADGTWSKVWDQSYSSYEDPLPAIREVPVAWLGQPLPRVWSVQLNPFGREEVTIDHLEHDTGCEGPAGISVKEQRTSIPSGAVDTTHIGLATVPQRSTLAIARASDEQAKRVGLSVTRAAMNLGDPQPVLHWLLEATGGPRDVFYFETRERSFTGKRGPAFVAGWVQVNEGGPRILNARIDSCGNEEKDLPCVIPLGVIPFADHDVWLMESPTGETTRFELWRVDAHGARAIVSFDGGGC